MLMSSKALRVQMLFHVPVFHFFGGHRSTD
jgi:hypothetical protein